MELSKSKKKLKNDVLKIEFYSEDLNWAVRETIRCQTLGEYVILSAVQYLRIIIF